MERVGIEKLGTLKTDKLLIRRESYKAQKASNICNAGFRLNGGGQAFGPFLGAKRECTFHQAAAFLEIWPAKADLKVISVGATTAPNEHASGRLRP